MRYIYIHQCGNSEASYDSAIEKFSILITRIGANRALYPLHFIPAAAAFCFAGVKIRVRKEIHPALGEARPKHIRRRTVRHLLCRRIGLVGVTHHRRRVYRRKRTFQIVVSAFNCFLAGESKGIKDGALGSVCAFERHRFLGRIYTVNWYSQILNLFFSSIFALSSFPFCLIDYIFLDPCTSKQVPSAKAHLSP